MMEIDEFDYEDWDGDNDIKGEPYIDEDRLYEEWVMRQIDRLDDDIRALFDSYVKGDKSPRYYKGSPEKFIQHAITTLESLKEITERRINYGILL